MIASSTFQTKLQIARAADKYRGRPAPFAPVPRRKPQPEREEDLIQTTLPFEPIPRPVQTEAEPEKETEGAFQPKSVVLRNVPWDPDYGLFENRIIAELGKTKYGLTVPFRMYYALLGESNLEEVTYKGLSPKGLRPEAVTLRVDVRKGTGEELPWHLSFSLLDFSVPGGGPQAAGVALRKRVRLTFADQEWELGLLQAIDTIDNWTDSAITAIRNQQELNRDQWIVSFWAEALAGVSIPSPGRFSGVTKSLREARRMVEEADRPGFRDNPEWVENQLALAEMYLRIAQIRFNGAYREWNEYRKGVIKGAATGKRICELAIVVITAPASLPLESALLAGVAETALQVGKSVFLDDQIDVVDILQASATAYFSSLVAGKMRGLFDSSLARYGDRGLKWLNRLTEQQLKQGLQFSLDGVVNEFRGKGATTEQITRRLVDRASAVWAGMVR